MNINSIVKHQDYFDIVKRCIDEWDPYNVLDEAPEDEYDMESEAIADNINFDMSSQEIAEVISKEFSRSFCEEWPVDVCIMPANKIYEWIKKI